MFWMINKTLDNCINGIFLSLISVIVSFFFFFFFFFFFKLAISIFLEYLLEDIFSWVNFEQVSIELVFNSFFLNFDAKFENMEACLCFDGGGCWRLCAGCKNTMVTKRFNFLSDWKLLFLMVGWTVQLFILGARGMERDSTSDFKGERLKSIQNLLWLRLWPKICMAELKRAIWCKKLFLYQNRNDYKIANFM